MQREIGERYFIFRIWNFYKNTQESFQALVDGPVQQNASKENYRDQGLTSFEREAKYLSIANWGINNDYYE